MITGKTTMIVHLGYPTEGFKAPMIYNPWFEAKGVDAIVVPLGVKGEDYAEVLKPLFRIANLRGALVTMPNKVATIGLVDELTTTAKVAGSANAILKRPDGSLLGDMFDGVGFVRGVERKGRQIRGARALVVGCGGVGSAIAASLAAAGAAALGLFDAMPASAESLGGRLAAHYPSPPLTPRQDRPPTVKYNNASLKTRVLFAPRRPDHGVMDRRESTGLRRYRSSRPDAGVAASSGEREIPGVPK